MKYDHLVKHNGIYYKAGEEVPEGASPKAEVEEEVVEVPTITKAQIMEMKGEELRALASEKEIEVPDGTNVAGAKKIIIEKLGL